MLKLVKHLKSFSSFPSLVYRIVTMCTDCHCDVWLIAWNIQHGTRPFSPPCPCWQSITCFTLFLWYSTFTSTPCKPGTIYWGQLPCKPTCLWDVGGKRAAIVKMSTLHTASSRGQDQIWLSGYVAPVLPAAPLSHSLHHGDRLGFKVDSNRREN